MIADARSQTLPAKGSPDHPGFDGAKAPPKLNAVVHVIDFGAGGVAPQVLWDEGKNLPKSFDLPHIQDTEVEGNEQHFVRVDHDRIGEIESVGPPVAFREQRQTAAISRIDMEPHLIFG